MYFNELNANLTPICLLVWAFLWINFANPNLFFCLYIPIHLIFPRGTDLCKDGRTREIHAVCTRIGIFKYTLRKYRLIPSNKKHV